MRTIDDLRGALELRARLADPRTADAEAPSVAAPISLAPTRTPRHRRATVLSAAVVLLALVGLAVQALTTSDKSTPVGSSGPPGPLPAGELVFSFTGAPDLTIRSYGWFNGEQQHLDLLDAGRRLELTVYAEQAAYGERGFPQLRAAADGSGLPGATRVTVGNAVAYYGAFGDTSSVTPGTVEEAAANMLVWQYGPDAWALLQQQGSIDEDGLLRVARALDFTHSTPVTTPIVFDAPAGRHLVDWQLTSRHQVDEDPSAPWTVRAVYSDDEGTDVTIEAYSHSRQVADGRTPVGTTVDGHDAEFRPPDAHLDFAALAFETAGGVSGVISWPTVDGVEATLDQLVALADTARTAGDPGDAKTWLDGRTVLP